ncbi:MAG: hypothetical protein LC685_02155 [Actinobacteria bacterium]|nr:hypothetical protein [Actinomycetota bacterium]
MVIAGKDRGKRGRVQEVRPAAGHTPCRWPRPR